MKNVLAVVPALIPSINLDIITPLIDLSKKHKLRAKIVLSSEFKNSDLLNIDVVLLHRNSDPNEIPIINSIKKSKVPCIYQIDDNFFELEPNNPIGRYHRNPACISTLIHFLNSADLVRMFSPLYIDYCKPIINKEAKLINAFFNHELIKNCQKQTKQKIRIVYTTSRSSGDNLQNIFLSSLGKILENYENQIEIYFWGAPPKVENKKLLEKIKPLKYVNNYEEYIKFFYEMNFDIGLAPLIDDVFHNCKTNNKFREFGGCEVAGIYTSTPLYKSSVEHLKTGVLTENTEDGWYESIKLLIENKSLLEEIKINAKNNVRTSYSYEQYCETLLSDINSVEHKAYEAFPTHSILYYKKQNPTDDIEPLIEIARDYFSKFRIKLIPAKASTEKFIIISNLPKPINLKNYFYFDGYLNYYDHFTKNNLVQLHKICFENNLFVKLNNTWLLEIKASIYYKGLYKLAFPLVILLKGSVSTIRYYIKLIQTIKNYKSNKDQMFQNMNKVKEINSTLSSH